MKRPDADQVIKGIADHDPGIIDFVYQSAFPRVRSMIKHNLGSEEDAKDVFQEAMLITYRRIKEKGLMLTCRFETYIYAVCRFIWLKALGARKQIITEYMSSDYAIKEQKIDKETEIRKIRLYEKCFNKLEPSCKKILKLYFEGISFEEIADIMGFSSGKVASVKKHRCKDHLARSITATEEFKELKDELYLTG